MNIGILLCGNTPESLINEFGEYSRCLEEQLNLRQYGTVSIWNVYQENNIPNDVNICDLYIIGGSPVGVNDNVEWIKPLTQFIQQAFNAKKRLFGICFGHQIIHHALGGKVKNSADGWGLGVYDVTLLKNLGHMKQGQTLSLLAIHQDQVIKPALKFQVVAGNNFCPNYITRYRDQVLTVQGHPEFNALFFSALIEERRDKFSPEELTTAFNRNPFAHDGDNFNNITKQFFFD
jgi:GMP synthase-like glutamine amidotransferase